MKNKGLSDSASYFQNIFSPILFLSHKDTSLYGRNETL